MSDTKTPEVETTETSAEDMVRHMRSIMALQESELAESRQRVASLENQLSQNLDSIRLMAAVNVCSQMASDYAGKGGSTISMIPEGVKIGFAIGDEIMRQQKEDAEPVGPTMETDAGYDGPELVEN